MTYTMQLLQPGNLDVTSAGGKGANLGEMISAGFPVPPGFVLTAAAYDAFAKENSLRQQIIDLVSKGAVSNPQAGEAASKAIKTLFLNAEIPEAVKVELFASYDELTTKTQSAVAVRSSAPFEDSPQRSFAGQHETFLGVVGAEALLEAVKECWASLWTARALAYRERMGIDHEAAAMAVVVHTMAPADVSGILFTANPTTGAREELVVNASFGLGEAIVSGKVTPDTYVLNRENMTVKVTTPGAKEVMIVSTAEGGTTTQSVPKARRIESALSPGLLGELAALGVRVEEHFGVPQDIEWSLVNGRFCLFPLF